MHYLDDAVGGDGCHRLGHCASPRNNRGPPKETRMAYMFALRSPAGWFHTLIPGNPNSAETKDQFSF